MEKERIGVLRLYTVTGRIKSIKQPYLGYLPIRDMDFQQYFDGNILACNENLHPSIVGLAVDYLSRYLMGDKAREAFAISLTGAAIAEDKGYAEQLLGGITGLNSISIISACKLSGYDSELKF